MAEAADDFAAAGAPPAEGAEALVVDLGAYEGPLDVLLALAREQKVDLSRISILTLAEQYLEFVARVRHSHLELAADYLVMAAWLAYLKSRLLLPEPPAEDQPSGEEMAAALAFQLERLDAMRKAGEALARRAQLGRDVFARGAPETLAPRSRTVWQAELYDLLSAYAAVRGRRAAVNLRIEPSDLYSVDEALGRLERMLGGLPRWSSLLALLPPGLSGLLRRSAVSSHLVAALELARQGRLELHQEGGAFGPLYVRGGGGGT